MKGLEEFLYNKAVYEAKLIGFADSIYVEREMDNLIIGRIVNNYKY